MRNKLYLITFIFLSFLFILLRLNIETNNIKFDKFEINNSINLSIKWYLSFYNTSGEFFYYMYYPNSNNFSKNNNIVRQIGGFYGLIKLYSYSKNNYLLELIYNFKNDILNYLVYKDDICYINYENEVVSNANALLLLSLLELYKLDLLNISEQKFIFCLKEGLLKYTSKKGTYRFYFNNNSKITPYGTGETLFALSSYILVFNDSMLINFTKQIFLNYYNSIIHSFSSKNYRAFFSWALLYLRNLYILNEKDFSIKYINELVIEAMNYRKDNYICADNGCITGYNTGEFSYFEGLSSVYFILVKEKILSNNLVNYFSKSPFFIISFQVKDKKDFLKKNKYLKIEKMPYKPNFNLIIGGFCDRPNFCNKIRVDYTQHAVSGLINILQ